MTVTYAVVPTAGRDCTVASLESIASQVNLTYVIWTDPADDVPSEIARIPGIRLVRAPDSEKNISKWWNTGLALAAADAAVRGKSEWNVIVMNDDVIAPSHLSAALDVAMRGDGPEDGDDILSLMRKERNRLFPDVRPTLVYPNAFSDAWVLVTDPATVDVYTRITGWCFMLRGEDWLFADPRLKWWFSDNQIDQEARLRGGSMCVPGCQVEHLHPNHLTSVSPELTAQTHVDRETFLRTWGHTAH